MDNQPRLQPGSQIRCPHCHRWHDVIAVHATGTAYTVKMRYWECRGRWFYAGQEGESRQPTRHDQVARFARNCYATRLFVPGWGCCDTSRSTTFTRTAALEMMHAQPTDTVSPAGVGYTQGAENFAFVLNVGRLVGAESFLLAPGHTLRRATTDEQEIIRETMIGMPAAPPFGSLMPLTHLWELPWPAWGELLPAEEWRYFVIAFEGNNSVVNTLSEVFAITQVEIAIGFTVIRSGGFGGGVVYPPAGHIFQVIQNAYPPSNDFFVDVSEAVVRDVADVLARLLQQDESGSLHRAVSQMLSLRALPSRSTMSFLGLFAILESLLTHLPQRTDPYDSITRQVKKKLKLLNNRFTTPLDYAPFGATSAEKIWEKMYSYRSTLAHGGTPTFTAGELQALRSHDHAHALLARTVKAVIRHGLDHPQLLVDLKDC